MNSMKGANLEVFIKMILVIFIICIFKGFTDWFIDTGSKAVYWWSLFPWAIPAFILGILLKMITCGKRLFKKENWKMNYISLFLFCLPILLILIFLHGPFPKAFLPTDIYLISFDKHYDQLLFNIFGYSFLSSFLSDNRN
ncbi:hypothetical protein BK138_34090 [Paenibacillus rhizosphaerae]|uniref:Uncharacterized protein n=1 Tax=Paenibacillus rhizosphaerae TaxID=297318 RepID=A0A1R1DZU9_9BACL|nr:hypothetical protein [Paenibacillus rhizosphaerae]OMF45002.1 hypothetical protein BK138_34090 [Paenibacillus rhizosphaerae]